MKKIPVSLRNLILRLLELVDGTVVLCFYVKSPNVSKVLNLKIRLRVVLTSRSRRRAWITKIDKLVRLVLKLGGLL